MVKSRGRREGIGLFPLVVAPGACLHVGYLSLGGFFPFCLLRRFLVSIV